MSMIEAIACKLCGANGHEIQLLETDGKGDGFYCPCCDRQDRRYKGFANHTTTPGQDEQSPPD